jgi:hypothetical protein
MTHTQQIARHRGTASAKPPKPARTTSRSGQASARPATPARTPRRSRLAAAKRATSTNTLARTASRTFPSRARSTFVHPASPPVETVLTYTALGTGVGALALFVTGMAILWLG